jgi:hypothetical protein
LSSNTLCKASWPIIASSWLRCDRATVFKRPDNSTLFTKELKKWL